MKNIDSYTHVRGESVYLDDIQKNADYYDGDDYRSHKKS